MMGHSYERLLLSHLPEIFVGVTRLWLRNSDGRPCRVSLKSFWLIGQKAAVGFLPQLLRKSLYGDVFALFLPAQRVIVTVVVYLSHSRILTLAISSLEVEWLLVVEVA